MLTDSEREWLKDRRNKTYCRYCSVIDLCSNPNASAFKCPLIPDYNKDAAEFEARVAAKLANPQWAVCWDSDSCLEFDGSKDEPRWVWNCEWCRLKHARLQVEEEMDAEMDK